MDSMFIRSREGRGRLEYRTPVALTTPNPSAQVLPGNGARYGIIFGAVFDTLADTNAQVLLGVGSTDSAHFVFSLTPGCPNIMVTYEQIGDLVFAAWSAITIDSADSVSATEIVYHPPED